MKRFCLVVISLVMLCAGGCSGRPAARTQVVQAQSRTGPTSRLRLPQGFSISIFACGLSGPRLMALSPDGRLFVTEMDGGRVTILPDANGDGRADSHITYANGLNNPHGIAFHSGYLYIAETTRVTRYPYRSGSNSATGREVIISGIPGGGHFTRTITFGPDGKLYLSVGASCNVCIESNPMRAAITQYSADGSGKRIFATGLRNAVGMTSNPVTGELWATDNGRDYLGDNIPPDSVVVVRQGGFYGWPYAFGNHVPDSQFGSRNPAKVRAMIPPTIAIQAHSAPLGLTFYTGSMFPAKYRNGLFVAYHGSWNRSVPTGYKVVWFPITNGSTPGAQQDFITGWLQGSRAWGRPVDVLVGRRGDLYITDDSAGYVYRVTYGR